ncbi:MAG: hypothetical protein ABEN55_11985 [Bradymonadaceae bacterium]
MIHLKQLDVPYTAVPNSLAQDSELSWKARGLLLFLISLPGDWKIRLGWLNEQTADGRHATKTGIEELEDAGYLYKRKRRRESGEFDGYDVWISPEPVEDWNTQLEGQSDRFRKSATDRCRFSATENPHLQNKHEQKDQSNNPQPTNNPQTDNQEKKQTTEIDHSTPDWCPEVYDAHPRVWREAREVLASWFSEDHWNAQRFDDLCCFETDDGFQIVAPDQMTAMFVQEDRDLIAEALEVDEKDVTIRGPA